MTYKDHIKVIHTAVSAPGAGKTEALISQIPSLLSVGRSIVLALPTIALTDSFISRCPADVSYRVVNSTSCNHVGSALQSALKQKTVHLVITTHQSVFAVEPGLLKGWTLIVDELPPVVDFLDFKFSQSELAQLFVNTEEKNGALQIREHSADSIKASLKTFKSVSAGGEHTSMLSKDGACIYECLQGGHPVFIDKVMASGERNVRAIVEHSCWETFAAVDEVHILAANIDGSLFDAFAKVHGFTYTRSAFTPEFEGYTSKVTIYPVMPKGSSYSKAKIIAPGDQQRQEELSVIDAALKTILKQTTGVPLLFCNKWAKFKWLPSGVVHRCSIDSRGLNEYRCETDAILLFGGNPSPSDQKGLSFLAEKYGREFGQEFLVTRLLEPSLQAATRTAVRSRDNTKPIHLFVQDERVADYLINTHMPHAVVDWSLPEEISVPKDLRKATDPRKCEVFALFEQNKKNTEIVKLIGISRNSASNWRREWKERRSA